MPIGRSRTLRQGMLAETPPALVPVVLEEGPVEVEVVEPDACVCKGTGKRE